MTYPGFVRKITRHEIGHTMGLDDVPINNPAGRTVMNGYVGRNDFYDNMPTSITSCDNNSINSIEQYLANCTYGVNTDPVCENTPGSNGYMQNFTVYPSGGCAYGFTANNPDNSCCMSPSPILIDVLGNGYNLTGTDNPVSFDFIGNNHPYTVSWTAAGSDDAFLVLDRNSNGTIDNGAELFGNFTPQPPSPNRNGFISLADYDKVVNGGNNDGRVGIRDAIFPSLKLWQDLNHNGVSESSELFSLRSKGVYAIDLDYTESRRTDQYGNRFKYRARVYDSQGAQVGRWAWDVFFQQQ